MSDPRDPTSEEPRPTAEPRGSAPLRGTRFAIATPHLDATAAGANAFDAGGNAVDAALAAATTLAVVYPNRCGVGGDLFALIAEPDGRTVVLNASGAAPAAIDVEALRRQHEEMPWLGPQTVTVPGAVAGWGQLALRWSNRGLAPAFTTPIALAREGVPVPASLARDLEAYGERVVADAGLSEVFVADGRPLRQGDALVQPALARTLAAIADAGPAAFYGEEIGGAIADHLGALGSAMTVDDLAAHEPELDSPVMGRYRDLDVSVPPPNSQGFVLLQALAAIERLGIDPDPFGPDAPVLAEIFRLTGADRDRHNSDPRHARVPIGTLLDDGHIAAILDQVKDPAAAAPPSFPAAGDPLIPGDTVALVAADDSGLAIVLIQSLYGSFGAGILEPTTGVIVHNRGAAFVLDPGHPNVVAGGKRPAHTLMPVVVHRDGALAAVTGTMGGGAQPQIDATTLIRAFDLGADAAAAVSAPRWLAGGTSIRDPERVVAAELAVPDPTKDALRRSGFRVDPVAHVDDVGHAHLILVLDDGGFEAGSDPRADGGAAVR